MNKFTSEMVDDLAGKLLIGLTREENKMVVEEMEIIDGVIDIVKDLAEILEVEPMTHPLDDFVVNLRCDEIGDSIPIAEALRNAAKTEGREIEIPKVVE